MASGNLSNGGVSTRQGVGTGTRIRCVVHDGTRVDFAGKNVDDLFKVENGVLVPRDPSLVRFDVATRNKMTLRGLSWQTLASLYGHTGTTTTKVPSDITFGETRNPFRAFIVLADAAGKPADVRPTWGESNLERDANIPDGLAPNTPLEGKRGIVLSVTTDGDFMRRVSTGYVSQTPYREAEFVIFARATQTHTKATGTITVTAYGSIVNADYIILDDGINPVVNLEFDTDTGPGVCVKGNARVDISAAASNDNVRDALIAAINAIGDQLHISAAIGGAGQVDLTHVAGGTLGDTTVDITNVTAGVSKSDMSGGAGAEGADVTNGNKEIDNLPIKAFAMAYGDECGGTSENESNIGLRAVLGRVPTLQGVRDRAYAHEICSFDGDGAGSITVMTDYTGIPATIILDGYIADSEDTEEVVADCDAGPSITVGTEHVSIPSAEWDLPETLGFKAGVHERLWLLFTGGTHDGEYHKIKRVVDSREVEVYSDLTADDATSVDVVRRFIGQEAFDGDVENEGRHIQPADGSDLVATVTLGQKWASEDTAGHLFGRVFASTKNIKGIRVIFPEGTNKDFCPNKFKIRTLNPDANGSDPRPGEPGDWMDLPASQHDYLTSNFQGDAIYEAGQYGVEYVFTNPVATQGVQLFSIDCYDPSRQCQIAELMVFEEPSTIALSSDYLKFSIDNGSNYERKALPDVAATIDYQLLVDSINAVLSGFQVEAIRSEFGYVWLRGTVAGDNSDLDCDDEDAADSSTCLVKLGLAPNTSTAPSATGVTEQIMKRTVDPMTFILRVNISGDHSQD